MKIYFLRHGEADWPHWDQPDDERPLTEQGRAEMERVGKFLRALRPEISLVLTSPLPRARQTAEIAVEHLRAKLREEPALGHGFNLAKLRSILEREKAGDLMLVGHEPGLSEVIHGLTGGQVKMAKGGLAAVALKDAGEGCLLWLAPPKITALQASAIPR